MAKHFIALGAALVIALSLSMAWKPLSFEERLVAIQMEEAAPELAKVLADEPIEIKALLMDYASDEVLQLKAQSGLIRYPRLARRILPIYGADEDFQAILREYGESVFLPIEYFLSNEVFTISVRHRVAQIIASLRGETTSDSEGALTPEVRGWYAIGFIKSEGHGFLGQFVGDGRVDPKWLQSERFFEAVESFFGSGIDSLERKIKTDQDINIADIGWVGVDALVVASSLKLVRLGRATAVSGKPLSFSTRTAALTSRAARVGRVGSGLLKHGKWPAIVLAGYAAIKHPGIINDTFASVSRLVGLPPWVGQFAGWLILLLPVFYLGAWIMRWMVSPTIRLLRSTVALLSRFEPSRG